MASPVFGVSKSPSGSGVRPARLDFPVYGSGPKDRRDPFFRHKTRKRSEVELKALEMTQMRGHLSPPYRQSQILHSSVLKIKGLRDPQQATTDLLMEVVGGTLRPCPIASQTTDEANEAAGRSGTGAVRRSRPIYF